MRTQHVRTDHGNVEFEFRLEVVNSLIHGIGMLFGIATIPVLISLAINSKNIYGIIGAAIYGFCFLMLFTFSTLYHGFREPLVKHILKIFDHISIYFLIAGTYTPFILHFVFNRTGITMLIILWSLTLVGSLLKFFYVNRFNVLSTIIYLLMGWIMLWGGKSFFHSLPGPILNLIIIGGIIYSLGVIFYLWERWTWSHAVWHTMVLAAAICHYAAVLLTVA